MHPEQHKPAVQVPEDCLVQSLWSLWKAGGPVPKELLEERFSEQFSAPNCQALACLNDLDRSALGVSAFYLTYCLSFVPGNWLKEINLPRLLPPAKDLLS